MACYKLNWPPSINHYWRTFRGRMLISEAGRAYRKYVITEIAGISSLASAMNAPRHVGRLAVDIGVVLPDHRRRDLDNLLKPLLDALQHAGLYLDDSQIDDLHIRRGRIDPPGHVLVTIQELSTQPLFERKNQHAST